MCRKETIFLFLLCFVLSGDRICRKDSITSNSIQYIQQELFVYESCGLHSFHVV